MQERLKNMTEQLAVLRADIVELMKHGEYVCCLLQTRSDSRFGLQV